MAIAATRELIGYRSGKSFRGSGGPKLNGYQFPIRKTDAFAMLGKGLQVESAEVQSHFDFVARARCGDTTAQQTLRRFDLSHFALGEALVESLAARHKRSDIVTNLPSPLFPQDFGSLARDAQDQKGSIEQRLSAWSAISPHVNADELKGRGNRLVNSDFYPDMHEIIDNFVSFLEKEFPNAVFVVHQRGAGPVGLALQARGHQVHNLWISSIIEQRYSFCDPLVVQHYEEMGVTLDLLRKSPRVVFIDSAFRGTCIWFSKQVLVAADIENERLVDEKFQGMLMCAAKPGAYFPGFFDPERYTGLIHDFEEDLPRPTCQANRLEPHLDRIIPLTLRENNDTVEVAAPSLFDQFLAWRVNMEIVNAFS